MEAGWGKGGPGILEDHVPLEYFLKWTRRVPCSGQRKGSQAEALRFASGFAVVGYVPDYRWPGLDWHKVGLGGSNDLLPFGNTTLADFFWSIHSESEIKLALDSTNLSYTHDVQVIKVLRLVSLKPWVYDLLLDESPRRLGCGGKWGFRATICATEPCSVIEGDKVVIGGGPNRYHRKSYCSQPR